MSWPRGSRTQKMLIALFFLSVRSTPKCDFGTARTVEMADEGNPLRAHLFQRNRKAAQSSHLSRKPSITGDTEVSAFGLWGL